MGFATRLHQQEGEELRRRAVLVGAGSVLPALLSGCVGDVGNYGAKTPEEVVEMYYHALNNGDHEEVRRLTHDERPDPITDQNISEWDLTPMEVSKVELIDESENKAVLETIILVETSVGSRIVTDEVELRKQNGEWRVYTIEAVDVQ